MTDKNAMKLALDALEANDQLINGTGTKGGLVYCMDGYYSDCFDVDPINKQTEEAIAALKEQLADHMREVQRLGQEIEQEADELTIAYMSGLYDGKKAQRTEQEPTAKYSDIVSDGGLDPRNKFDVSPQRTWVGLTDEELNQICNSLDYYGDRGLVQLIEAKLKEKNT
jgi:hypothetical protein